jgi:hypothetical protein
VSLSKDAPFTFVDHALKCGDSLVGLEKSEIKKALKGASRQGELLEGDSGKPAPLAGQWLCDRRPELG